MLIWLRLYSVSGTDGQWHRIVRVTNKRMRKTDCKCVSAVFQRACGLVCKQVSLTFSEEL